MAARLRSAVGIIILGALGLPACDSDPAVERAPGIDRARLEEIVLGPEEGLPGLEYDPSLSGSADQYLQRQFGADWPPAGYESSFQSFFQGPFPQDPGSLPVEKVRGLVSLAMLFETSEAAGDYLTVNHPPSWRLGHPGFNSLGEERRGLVTETTGGSFADPNARPRQTTLIWRRGNILLQLNVLGEFALEDVIPLAQTVDGRAAEALTA